MSTVSELLAGHVTLTVESLDRIYLNGFIPNLQTAGQLVTFLSTHRGNPIPSPALLKKNDDRFEADLSQFAASNGLTRVKFVGKQRKDDVAASHRAKFTGTEGVYLLGSAQEKCNSFKATTSHDDATKHVSVGFGRQPAFVTHYYFYLVDSDFGPAFIKVCTYAPYGLRICLNGHEWAKRQLEKEGIAYEALDNGFKSCANPERLQQLCDSLGPQQILDFLYKWLDRLPMPLTAQDRAAGYGYCLSIWQLEVSRTQVFDVPAHGREFFEEVIRENLDLGRPDRVSLVFDRAIYKTTPGDFCTRVFEDGVHPSLHIKYKSCHVKQYFKENWALRTETTINKPDDFYIRKDISHLDELRSIGRAINLRLLEVERVSQACTLSQSTVEQITHPTVTPDGQRVPALRFGDTRPMALWSSLTLMCHLPQGFSNGSLREHVHDLLGPDTKYGANQMTYDLRRMRRKNLIERVGHSHRYRLTELGLKVALFFSKIHSRLFKPASACFDGAVNSMSTKLNDAMQQLQIAIDSLTQEAKFEPAS
jgi:hypothetical protein